MSQLLNILRTDPLSQSAVGATALVVAAMIWLFVTGSMLAWCALLITLCIAACACTLLLLDARRNIRRLRDE